RSDCCKSLKHICFSFSLVYIFSRCVIRIGLEPITCRLRAGYSTIELTDHFKLFNTLLMAAVAVVAAMLTPGAVGTPAIPCIWARDRKIIFHCASLFSFRRGR